MFLLKKFSRICCLLFSYQCSLFLLSSQATALIDYHIFCRLSTTFLFFFVASFQRLSVCLSDEDYLIILICNCQRFSCFLFISHNSDNSLCLLILYTKYLFSTSTYTKHIIILKNYYYSQYSSRTSVRLGAWFWSAKLTYSYQNHCASSRSVYLSRRLDSHWDKFAITHHLKRWESSRLR